MSNAVSKENVQFKYLLANGNVKGRWYMNGSSDLNLS
jgi:hypothetical protein